MKRGNTMHMYICRWENGDFSVVQARTKQDAIVKLDEVGAAEASFLTKMHECQIHFALTDEGRGARDGSIQYADSDEDHAELSVLYALESFGEWTYEEIEKATLGPDLTILRKSQTESTPVSKECLLLEFRVPRK
jgi:hypothetical protein